MNKRLIIIVALCASVALAAWIGFKRNPNSWVFRRLLRDQYPVVDAAPLAQLSRDVTARVAAAAVLIVADKQSGSAAFVETRDNVDVLLTNAHVVLDDNGDIIDDLKAVFSPGGGQQNDSREATVRALDVALDVAIVEVLRPAQATAQPLPMNKKRAPAGSRIYVAGYPYGFGLALDTFPDVNITTGRVQGRADEQLPNLAPPPSWIMVEAGIHPGNSGGPVVDASGAVVGLAVAKVIGTMRGFYIPTADILAWSKKAGDPLKPCALCGIDDVATTAPGTAPTVTAPLSIETPRGEERVLVLGKGMGSIGTVVVAIGDVDDKPKMRRGTDRYTGKVLRRLEGLGLALVSVDAPVIGNDIQLDRQAVVPTEVLFGARRDDVDGPLHPVVVTSLRHGYNGDPRLVQVDLGDVAGAEAIGPLFDSSGKVRGFAVGRLDKTEIAVAVTAEAIDDIRMGSIVARIIRVTRTDAWCVLSAAVIIDDPLNLARSIVLAAEPAGRTPINAADRGVPPVGDVVARKAAFDGDIVFLSGALRCDDVLTSQVRLQMRDGTTRSFTPANVQIDVTNVASGPGHPPLAENVAARMARAMETSTTVFDCDLKTDACEVGCTVEGRPHDCVVLGGRMLAVDPRRAFQLLNSACADGDADGCATYGEHLLNGVGGQRDVERGLQLLLDACRRRVGYACRAGVGWAELLQHHMRYELRATACDNHYPTICEGPPLTKAELMQRARHASY